ncbi:TolC family protein [Flavobacterium sp.]|uniref:TolC family protein n=3 Tax=Flavobacterium sp. TaxID=239 RepID=UPI004047C47C
MKKTIKYKIQKFYFILLLFWSALGVAQNDLNFYIKTAKNNSPLITDNKNQTQANQQEIERLKAFYTKPQIGITANYLLAPIFSNDINNKGIQLNPTNAENYYGYDLGATNGGQYQALLNLSQPLFNRKRFKTVTEQIDVNSKINQNNIKLSEHDIEKIITDQYLICIQDKKQIVTVNQMITILENQKSILNKLVTNSIYKQSDETLLNIEYQNYQGQLATLKANYQRDLFDLNILCGIDDNTVINLTENVIELTSEKKSSAFVEKFNLDSLNLATQQKIIELKYKPQLNAFVNTGLNAVNINTLSSRFGLSAGLSFTYSLFDGNQKKITRNKTEELQKTVTAYKLNFNNQNSMRKTKILAELNSYPERIKILEQQSKEYDMLLDSYKKEMLVGQLSIINYIITLKNKMALARELTLLQTQQQLLINNYNYWNW